MKQALFLLLIATTLSAQNMEKKVNFESLSPNLIVADVNKAVDYYTKTLGFTRIASVPESGVLNWAMVMRDGITMMFQSLPSIQEDMPGLKIQAKGSLGTFYIKIKGVDAFYKELKGKVDVAVDMRTTFYGAKEFVIKDLDGYFLAFAEDVK
jgi:uncharacterized glyoxalase superfamily protein PhnB